MLSIWVLLLNFLVVTTPSTGGWFQTTNSTKYLILQDHFLLLDSETYFLLCIIQILILQGSVEHFQLLPSGPANKHPIFQNSNEAYVLMTYYALNQWVCATCTIAYIFHRKPLLFTDRCCCIIWTPGSWQIFLPLTLFLLKHDDELHCKMVYIYTIGCSPNIL